MNTKLTGDGHTYPSDATCICALWYVKNAPATTTVAQRTVTITLASASPAALHLFELSGRDLTAPLDVMAEDAPLYQGSALTVQVAITPTQSGVDIVAISARCPATDMTSPFALLHNSNSWAYEASGGAFNQPVGAVTATFNPTVTNSYAIRAAAFRATAAAPGPTGSTDTMFALVG